MCVCVCVCVCVCMWVLCGVCCVCVVWGGVLCGGVVRVLCGGVVRVLCGGVVRVLLCVCVVWGCVVCCVGCCVFVRVCCVGELCGGVVCLCVCVVWGVCGAVWVCVGVLPPISTAQDIRTWVQGKSEAEVMDLYLQVKYCLVSLRC